MSFVPRYFRRITGSVNFPLLQGKLVVIVGVGTVGSKVAHELARVGVGHLRFIDHDRLEIENLVRHILPVEYVGWNKAEGLAVYLADQVEGLQAEAAPWKVDRSVSDALLDRWLADADLIVAATDDRDAQRRIGRRALALSVPAIFPALYGDDGGEVVVQLDSRFPCFYCWDGFRENEEQLRGVTAVNATNLPIIGLATRISLGILDPHSRHRRMLVSAPNRPPNQIFEQEPFAALRMAPLMRRPNCPSCAVGPAASTQSQTFHPPSHPSPPLPPALSYAAPEIPNHSHSPIVDRVTEWIFGLLSMIVMGIVFLVAGWVAIMGVFVFFGALLMGMLEIISLLASGHLVGISGE